MIYNKLVRNLIPEHIVKNGGAPHTHIASEEEYRIKLKEKLREEIGEFERDETVEELADVLEVIDAIIDYKGFSREEIAKVKAKKAEERGKFEKRIILDES